MSWEDRYVSPCPPPTPRQREILDILIEECAEVIQRATKMLRFGVEEVQPQQHLTNKDRLSFELGDLKAIVNEAIEARLADRATIENSAVAKRRKLERYMQTTEESR